MFVYVCLFTSCITCAHIHLRVCLFIYLVKFVFYSPDLKSSADKHDWTNGPQNKHSWVSDSADKQGWTTGPADNHGWDTGPLEFALVEEPGPSQGTENVLWHNEPFDFSTMEVDPRQPTDSAIWSEPRDPGFTDPPGDPQVRADVEKSVVDPSWDPNPADWSYWLQRTDTRWPRNRLHNFLVAEPESIE